MYTQKSRGGGGFFIPSNYRGNALYFEELCSSDRSADDSERSSGDICECKSDRSRTPHLPPPKAQEGSGCLCGEEEQRGSASFLGGVLNSEYLPIILVALLLFFSRDKEESRCDEGTWLILALLLLL